MEAAQMGRAIAGVDSNTSRGKWSALRVGESSWSGQPASWWAIALRVISSGDVNEALPMCRAR
jgi:hypothetical protein